jgi:hypothetical protein
MLKWLFLSVTITAISSFVLAETADQRPFGEVMARAAIVDQAKSPSAKCPLSREYLNETDLSLIAICSEFGLVAHDAARRYPTSGPKVFALYGKDQTMRDLPPK